MLSAMYFSEIANDKRQVAITENLYIQAILGNDQNASPTNQKTAGSKLDRTS